MMKRTAIFGILIAVLLMTLCVMPAMAEDSGCDHHWVFHEYLSPLDAPTCTDPGLAEYVCSICNYAKVSTVPATGHTPGPAVSGNRVEATATTDGHYDMLVYCTTCGALLSSKTVTIPKTGVALNEELDLVSDTVRTEKPYVMSMDETADGESVLVITAQPDEDGQYTLRNLHLKNYVLDAIREENITFIRFIVGNASVEFPVAIFESEAIDQVKAQMLEVSAEFIVTVDPQAATEDGVAGCAVSVVIVDSEGTETGVTELLENIVLTLDGEQIPVNNGAAVYTVSTEAAQE